VDADLDAVAAALAELKEAELHALVETANELVLIAAGLLSWVEHLADWEINRRAGLELPLQAPHTAIPPEEGADSIAAARRMRDQFAQGPTDESPNVAALFDAVVEALGGRASPA
jgi:hypothetical protein